MSTAALLPGGRQVTGGARRYYFIAAFVLILVLSLAAFSGSMIAGAGNPGGDGPNMFIHGLFALAWMAVLVLQASFVRAGNMRLHRKLATVGLTAAAGLTLSTAYLFVEVWNGWDAMPPYVKANRILLPAFSVFVLLGYLNRRRQDIHKRLIYCGTLFLLGPILSRITHGGIMPLLPAIQDDLAEPIANAVMMGIWSAFFLSLFVYDRLVVRRVHPVSMISYAWLLTVAVFVHLI